MQATDIANVLHMQPEELAYYCNTATQQELFESYHLYSCPNYFSYICKLPGYEDFILQLHGKIQQDHGLRKSLRHMVGFKGKNGFLHLIDKEAERIKNERIVQKYRRQKDELRSQQEKLPHLCITDRSTLQQLQTTYMAVQNETDPQYATRCQQRIDAINQTVSSQGARYDYSSQIQHPAFTDPYADVFNNCYGTALDKQLHEELCETRTTMMQLQNNYPDLMQVRAISPVVYHFTAIAKEHPNADVAFGISDFCYYLTKAAQGFGDTSLVVLRGVGKGAVNIVEHNAALCKSLATHPIDEVLKPLCQAGIALGKAVFYATELAVTNPDQFDQQAYRLVTNLGNYVRDNPEEAIADIIEFLIPLKADSLLQLKQVQTVVKAIQEQKQFAQAIQLTTNFATKITTPLQEILVDASAVVSVGLEHGKDAVRNLIKVAQQQPEITSVGDIAALMVPGGGKRKTKKLLKIKGPLGPFSTESLLYTPV